jgi:hypothetical protein
LKHVSENDKGWDYILQILFEMLEDEKIVIEKQCIYFFLG